MDPSNESNKQTTRSATRKVTIIQVEDEELHLPRIINRSPNNERLCDSGDTPLPDSATGKPAAGPSKSRKTAPLPTRARGPRKPPPSSAETQPCVTPQEMQVEVPPEGGVLEYLPGRHPLLPVVYRVESHPLVEKPHGTIYIGVLDLSRAAMENLFVAAANMELPNSPEQIKAKGVAFLLQYISLCLTILPRLCRIIP